MKARIYVACPWLRRPTASAVAAQLRSAGHLVTSRWHDSFTGDATDTAVLRQEAAIDKADVLLSDVFLLLNLEKSEGKAVEMGLALAWDLRIIVVGEPSNIFHYLPQVVCVDSVGAALKELEGERVRVPTLY